MTSRHLALAAVVSSLSFCTFTTGCGSPALPVAPPRATMDPGFTRERVAEPVGVDPSPAAPFRLAPGDVISVRVTAIEMGDGGTLAVDAKGEVSLPMIGEVRVSGSTLSDAEHAITHALQRVDALARATVMLVDPQGHRATILGAVDHPGIVPLRMGMKLSEAIATTGGPLVTTLDSQTIDLADMEAARLVRDGKTMPISVARALEGSARHDLTLEPGDVVVVPPSRGRRVTVLGCVRAPRGVPFHRGMRLTETLADAGGTTAEADHGDIRILRGPLSAPRLYRADIRALFAGKSLDVELEPGDVVFVTEHWTATVGEVLQRLTPGLATAAIGVAVLK